MNPLKKKIPTRKVGVFLEVLEYHLTKLIFMFDFIL